MLFWSLEEQHKFSTANLLNGGRSDNFVITLNTDASSDELQYFEGKFITPNVVNIQQNSAANIVVEVTMMYL